MLNVSAIPALRDNYIWLIRLSGHNALVVDPGDAAPVIDRLTAEGLNLAGVLLTHHHNDHAGGIPGLASFCQAMGYALPVYGPASNMLTTHPCHEGDTVQIEGLPSPVRVLEVPGHTLDHLAFVIDDALFCGDTLFSAGCGRLFEGTAEDLFQSLTKLASLDDSTRVFCAHEYTAANLRFARHVEPANEDINQYLQKVNHLVNFGEPSLPSTIAQEKTINPFLRTHLAEIRTAVAAHSGQTVPNPVTCFTLLRQWKDNF